MPNLRRQAARFAFSQDGAATIFGVFLFAGSLMLAGLALDISNAYRVRTQLQVAGDAAGHAALVAREFNSAAVAKAKALEIARAHLPQEKYGAILRDEDIVFGHWDSATKGFANDPTAFDAVLVNTARAHERFNSVSTFLLRFAGVGALDVRRQTVFETYRPTCFREGFVAEERVDVTSNNTYDAGFCVHSNAYVEVNNNNHFADGTIVSMPDRRDLVMPTGGFDSNGGLEAALRDGSYKIRILQRIDDIIDGVQAPGSAYYPTYITNDIPVSLHRNEKLDGDLLLPGHVYRIDCHSPSQKATIHAGTLLKELVIWTDCELKFGQGVELNDVIIVNDSTSSTSFNAASGVQIGKDDSCATGGGAQLVTRGGIEIPAQLEMHGGQMLAAGDISFTAEADGIQGASIIAGGQIDGTAGSVMGFCNGAGMEDNFEAEYFRLAH